MAVSKEKEWFPERRRSGIGGQPTQMGDDLIDLGPIHRAMYSLFNGAGAYCAGELSASFPCVIDCYRGGARNCVDGKSRLEAWIQNGYSMKEELYR